MKGSKVKEENTDWEKKSQGKNKEDTKEKWKSSQSSGEAKKVRDKGTQEERMGNKRRTDTKERLNLHTRRRKPENRDNTTVLWHSSRRV